jgi:chromosome segregation ATPase
MWNDIKQQRLNALQRQEQEGSFTQEEQQALEQLLHELEQEEWDSMRPALASFRQEQTQLQEECGELRSQSTVLAALAERQEGLLKRAKGELVNLLREHETLKIEYERVTGQPLLGPRT